jgi:hypothetical protein
VARKKEVAALVAELAPLHQEVFDAVSVIPDTKTKSLDILYIGEGYTALDRSLSWALRSNQIDRETRNKLEALRSRVWKQLSRIEIAAGVVVRG